MVNLLGVRQPQCDGGRPTQCKEHERKTWWSSENILSDTINNGKAQKMYFLRGGQRVAKGMKTVLEERGISTEV